MIRVLVLGAGAIGGYFGGRLQQGGRAEVAFLVREGRRAAFAARGLRIDSAACGDYAAPARALGEAEAAAASPFDVVLLACKAYDLDGAVAAVEPAVGPATAVLPLLNGVSHLDALNARFGSERVLGGLARISATLAPDGTVLHMNDWRDIAFGEQSGTMTERVLALQAAFTHGASARAVPDIRRRLWEKFVHLATVAAMTCLMRANVGEIARAPGGTALMAEALEANAAIASAEGFAPGDDFLDQYRALFADTGSTYAASMLRDLESGGPVEAEHILGFALARARYHGVSAKLLEAAYAHLKAYEVRRAVGRLP
jgi:2-dehydropantoate 2-reductase